MDWARKVFATRAVGHCGTLDPMATGLMVLLINEATKLSQYILEKDKAYKLRAEFGWTTDTLDRTGKELSRQSVSLSKEAITQAVFKLQGEQELPVPLFSAIQVDGVRLHEVAREHSKDESPDKREITTPLKLMNFFELEILATGTDWVELQMKCSKGSYVRSWVKALGQLLGTGATLTQLSRLESWPYSLREALPLREVERLKAEGKDLESLMIPLHLTLPDYKTVRVHGLDKNLALNGQISHGLKSQLISVFDPQKDRGVKLIGGLENRLLAIVGVDPGKGFVFRRVFRESFLQ